MHSTRTRESRGAAGILPILSNPSHPSSTGEVFQHDVGGVVAGCSGYFAAGMAACAAEVEVLDG